MHELSLALAIVDAATEAAMAHEGGRVTVVRLRLGVCSGVVREALASAFAMARAGSALDGADLAIEEVPAAGFCSTCAAEQPVASPVDLRCTVCGTAVARLTRGRELEVYALEMES